MKDSRPLALEPAEPFRALTGVGGIGSGICFALEGNHTLGRNESRPGRILDVRDYCKLHIIAHYAAVLLRANPLGRRFNVLPIGKVGDDAIGQHLLEEMRRAGMDTQFVDTQAGLPTMLSVCFQYPDGSGGNITTSESAASALTARDVDRALDAMASRGTRFVALAAPEVPLDVRRHLLASASSYGAFRAAAFTSAEIPAVRDSGMLTMVDLLSMNEDEAQALTGVPFDGGAPGALLDACEKTLTELNRDMRVAVTAGKSGAYALHRGSVAFCPAVEVEASSTAGAGDAFLGGIIAGLVAGMPFMAAEPQRRTMSERPLASAFEFACLLAGFTITSPHTIHPDASLGSVLAFASQHGISIADGLVGRRGAVDKAGK